MSLPVLNDSLQSYFVDVNRLPLLTKEEEYELACRWYDKKDLDAAHKLVTSNLRFVVKLAYEYRSYGMNLKDLIQEGNIGLMHAVKKFDPYKGCRLITYASWWIKTFIQDYIIKAKGLVKRSTKALKKKLFYRNPKPVPDISNRGEGEFIHKDFSISKKDEVESIVDFSLDNPLTDDDGMTHLERLIDASPSQEELVAGAQVQTLVKRDVKNALLRLNQNERYVIEKRVMSEEHHSLASIGSELGLSRERVRQVENAALKKLGKSLLKHTDK